MGQINNDVLMKYANGKTFCKYRHDIKRINNVIENGNKTNSYQHMTVLTVTVPMNLLRLIHIKVHKHFLRDISSVPYYQLVVIIDELYVSFSMGKWDY